MRRIAVLVLAVGMVIGCALPAMGAPKQAVDQGGLTPPLNPDLTWSCTNTGGGPVCRGAVDETYENEPFEDVTCDGRQVYISGTLSDRATRWHTPDGRATKTNAILKSLDVFSLSPTGEGPSMVVRSTSVRHYHYPIPGDRDTRVLTETGAAYISTAPGRGLLFHDVGLIRFKPGAQNDWTEIDVVRGPHDLYASDFAAIEAALCEVLG